MNERPQRREEQRTRNRQMCVQKAVGDAINRAERTALKLKGTDRPAGSTGTQGPANTTCLPHHLTENLDIAAAPDGNRKDPAIVPETLLRPNT